MTTLFQTDNLRLDLHNGAACLWLDVAGRSLNVFSRQVIADLNAAFDQAKANTAIKVLFILSAKSAGFIAGADIHEFTQVSGPADAAALTKRGQDLFGKLAELPPTTVAIIHGACLGGGLELALACDYRYVAPGVKEALPTHEHFVPVIVAMGAAIDAPGAVTFQITGFTGGLTRRSVQFA